MRFLLLALAVVSAVSATGCLPGLGCDAGEPNYDATPVTLTSPTTTASRVSECGSRKGAFAGGFTLAIDAPDGSLVVTIDRSVPVGQAIPLNVPFSSAPQEATADDGTLSLSYTPGPTPADTTELAAAVVTVVTAPAPGSLDDTLSVTLDLHFLDGRELSGTFAAPVEQETPCAVE